MIFLASASFLEPLDDDDAAYWAEWDAYLAEYINRAIEEAWDSDMLELIRKWETEYQEWETEYQERKAQQ